MPLPPSPFYVSDVPTTFVSDSRGLLVEPFSLEYVVYDTSSEAKRAAPVQVYPASGRAVAAEVSLGYYKADYVPGVDEAKGRRLVRWFCVYEEGDAERSWSTPWEVLTGGRMDSPVPLYAMVSDVRAEGIGEKRLSDVRAQLLLQQVGNFIDNATGRTFAPVPKVLALDGSGKARLHVPEELVALDRVYLGRKGEHGEAREDVAVFNRHLTQRLQRPDDRNNPKLEREFYAFPCGRSNVHVAGVFGYTEWDGSPMGRTPERVRRLALLLLIRELPVMGSADRGEASMLWRVTQERTRDQSVTFAGPTSGSGRPGTALLGAFTGDPEIDLIIASLVRPPTIRAV